MDLETAFYIVGIVFMVTMLLLIIGLLSAVRVIRNKVNHIHDEIAGKLSAITNVVGLGSRAASILAKTVKHAAHK